MNPDAATAAAIALYRTLTPRQREIAVLVGEGLSNKEVARAVCVSEQTVKNHLTNILKVIKAHHRGALIYLVAYLDGYEAATAKQRVKIVTHKETEAA